MLSYPIDEAETLLNTKLSTAQLSLSNCEEDLDFLREQITVSFEPTTGADTTAGADRLQTMEVAIARVYNWEVVQKRKEKGDEKEASKPGEETTSNG